MLKQKEIINLLGKEESKVNFKILDAVKAIQAERSGQEPIAWQDFSSHTKS